MKFGRKVVAWPLSWLCYWAGDLISKPMNWANWLAWLYPIYNRLMTWSYDLQEWGGYRSHGAWWK